MSAISMATLLGLSTLLSVYQNGGVYLTTQIAAGDNSKEHWKESQNGTSC